jgi:hypothetical protein
MKLKYFFPPLVFILSWAFCTLIYWAGGNDFERGGALQGYLVYSMLVSIAMTVPVVGMVLT